MYGRTAASFHTALHFKWDFSTTNEFTEILNGRQNCTLLSDDRDRQTDEHGHIKRVLFCKGGTYVQYLSKPLLVSHLRDFITENVMHRELLL